MPSKDAGQRLQDILDNIEAIRAFTAGMDQAAFTADRKTVYAVTRALEIISEASRRLPDDLKARHREIHWPAVAAAGNVYRHDYEWVAADIVWKTITTDLDRMEAISRGELDRLDRR